MTYPAYETVGEDRPGPWLVTCDHATNAVPPMICGGDLGLSEADMGRHIAYDIGAAGVTRHLADLLDAPAILSTWSRLVIDPNRGEDDPTLLMQLYDGTVIEGNRNADAAERLRRMNLLYRPYHAALERMAEARPENSVYLAIHSFTPRLNGRTPRPWKVGVLYAYDARFARPLIDGLQAEGDICVGENEPYCGALYGDSVDRHALHHGRLNALIELRHDLIDTESGQREWAERLAPILIDALAHAKI
ncbi:MAG: N-formylglutamate amidohydrolase [Rhodobacteraceae bacterium]|nr:N-formylglutamate amidohydrolase [Paracoccaceae bacterium]